MRHQICCHCHASCRSRCTPCSRPPQQHGGRQRCKHTYSAGVVNRGCCACRVGGGAGSMRQDARQFFARGAQQRCGTRTQCRLQMCGARTAHDCLCGRAHVEVAPQGAAAAQLRRPADDARRVLARDRHHVGSCGDRGMHAPAGFSQGVARGRARAVASCCRFAAWPDHSARLGSFDRRRPCQVARLAPKCCGEFHKLALSRASRGHEQQWGPQS
mmetsp:Transcript_55329/g.81306  ORF Transcript_55329/g.81306 Transcript_55329/m.81306 type:complete len:215 (+) Transcript_55329:3931-4575(+)